MSRVYSCNINCNTMCNLKIETQDLISKLIDDVTLYGGESDSEYAERIANDIWNIEGKYFRFEIMMTYLEDLPYETYEFGRDEYCEIRDCEEDQ